MIRYCSRDNPFAAYNRVRRATIRDAILFLKGDGVRVRLDPTTQQVTTDALFNVGRYRKVGVLFLVDMAHQRGMTPRPKAVVTPKTTP